MVQSFFLLVSRASFLCSIRSTLDLLNILIHPVFMILLIPGLKLHSSVFFLGIIILCHITFVICVCSQNRSVWRSTFLTAFQISISIGNSNKCIENLLSLWQPHQTSCQPHQMKISHLRFKCLPLHSH